MKMRVCTGKEDLNEFKVRLDPTSLFRFCTTVPFLQYCSVHSVFVLITVPFFYHCTVFVPLSLFWNTVPFVPFLYYCSVFEHT